eukprot:2070708-Amphidinium_carterae.2
MIDHCLFGFWNGVIAVPPPSQSKKKICSMSILRRFCFMGSKDAAGIDDFVKWMGHSEHPIFKQFVIDRTVRSKISRHYDMSPCTTPARTITNLVIIHASF